MEEGGRDDEREVGKEGGGERQLGVLMVSVLLLSQPMASSHHRFTVPLIGISCLSFTWMKGVQLWGKGADGGASY